MPLPVLLPPHLAVRAPTRDDLPAIFALIQASDLDIFGRHDFTMQELQHEWSRPEFDPAIDAWVVELPDGSFVGYGHTVHWQRTTASMRWGSRTPTTTTRASARRWFA